VVGVEAYTGRAEPDFTLLALCKLGFRVDLFAAWALIFHWGFISKM